MRPEIEVRFSGVETFESVGRRVCRPKDTVRLLVWAQRLQNATLRPMGRLDESSRE
jgi:hypothetical protein